MLFYQLRVQLLDIDPPIWRRLRVPGSTRLSRFHRILQEAMGWTDSHLHLYDIKGKLYGEPDPDWGMRVYDQRNITLEGIFSSGHESFLYEYDMGDSWRHRITLEKELEGTPKDKPVCIAGARTCPPEDCGGPFGYTNILVALSDPDHEDHEMYVEWIGTDFDPNEFFLDDINDRLKTLR